MLYNAIPVILFIAICFCCESNIQLFYAKIASVIYAFIMLAVLVATISQIILESKPLSSSHLILSGIFANLGVRSNDGVDFSDRLASTSVGVYEHHARLDLLLDDPIDIRVHVALFADQFECDQLGNARSCRQSDWSIERERIESGKLASTLRRGR